MQHCSFLRFSRYSGVAWVPCARGQKYIFATPPTKYAEFEVKKIGANTQ